MTPALLSSRTLRRPTAPQRGPSRRMYVRATADNLGGGFQLPSLPGGVGNKVEKWMKTPFDIAAFGPRAAWGALLSAPTRLQTLTTDLDKLRELVQDPRPVEEKSAVVLREVEDTVVEFLEKGATLETDVLSNIKQMLPTDIASRLDTIIPQPPNSALNMDGRAGVQVYEDGMDALSSASSSAQTVVYDAASVLQDQVASEVTEIRSAVVAVKKALEAIQANADPAAGAMLKLNLREARDMLARRLAEVSANTAGDAKLAAAEREASILLGDVDAQFFSL